MKKPFPRISTRGYYNLDTGNTIKKVNSYFVYPKSFFDSIVGTKELTIMMHGLRNDNASAVNKFVIAQKRLKQIGYSYPVVGFSYDSNTKGAHLAKSALHALHVGQKIARKNGKNLSRFILDFKRSSPETKIRLMGHSLGSQVILHTVENLAKNPKNRSVIESIHFFGGSITAQELRSLKYSKMLQRIINKKIVNYYSLADAVLKHAHEHEAVVNPIGYLGCTPTIPLRLYSKYTQKKVWPKNHRFASYAETIKSFP